MSSAYDHDYYKLAKLYKRKKTDIVLPEDEYVGNKKIITDYFSKYFISLLENAKHKDHPVVKAYVDFFISNNLAEIYAESAYYPDVKCRYIEIHQVGGLMMANKFIRAYNNMMLDTVPDPLPSLNNTEPLEESLVEQTYAESLMNESKAREVTVEPVPANITNLHIWFILNITTINVFKGN